MKQIVFILIILLALCNYSVSQTIPIGISIDTIPHSNGYNHTGHEIYYYKPAAHDSNNSPVLWAMHGLQGNGMSPIDWLQEIADRRNALIVAPTAIWPYWLYSNDLLQDTSGGNIVYIMHPLPLLFKEIYRHVLARESRDSIPVYLTGWSAGGQLVTRYMFLRQAFADSIPIQMAVSVNPFFYTFPTDTFQGEDLPFPCGISSTPNMNVAGKIYTWDFMCEQHVKQYYNENYGVLIGTYDVTPNSWWACAAIEGPHRYARAKNFYNFSDTDAVNRGTTLLWKYDSVLNVGHVNSAMYNRKLDPTDSFTIAEVLIFDSQHHPTAVFPPEADFTWTYADKIDSLCNNKVLFSAKCAKNRYPNTVLWDFGEGGTSNEYDPIYDFAEAGTYSVTLAIANSVGTDTLTQSVVVAPSPIYPEFMVYLNNTNLSLPNAAVQFINNTANATSYRWEFGDDSTSTNVNPLHQYLNADTFTVSLSAMNIDMGCYNKTVKENLIIVPTAISSTSFIGSNTIKFGAYPNPFKRTTSISFALIQPDHVDLIIYNYLGQVVLEIFSNNVETGRLYSAEFDASDLPAGLYYCVMHARIGVKVLKLTISN